MKLLSRLLGHGSTPADVPDEPLAGREDRQLAYERFLDRLHTDRALRAELDDAAVDALSEGAEAENEGGALTYADFRREYIDKRS